MDISKEIERLKTTHICRNIDSHILDILDELSKSDIKNYGIIQYLKTATDEHGDRLDHQIAIINGLMNKKPEQSQERLKLCLNCDGIADYHEKTDYDYRGQDSREIECHGCKTRLIASKDRVSKRQLIAIWNRD